MSPRACPTATSISRYSSSSASMFAYGICVSAHTSLSRTICSTVADPGRSRSNASSDDPSSRDTRCSAGTGKSHSESSAMVHRAAVALRLLLVSAGHSAGLEASVRCSSMVRGAVLVVVNDCTQVWVGFNVCLYACLGVEELRAVYGEAVVIAEGQAGVGELGAEGYGLVAAAKAEVPERNWT
ncbi:hypothetical protein DFP73DRAFT_556665 [Morchella snyderi]|nr:hypothetical protein DFP73DRAFT_556665 [Morchella snyderi]